MTQKKGGDSKGSKASALLKTMGRGSPRTRALEPDPEPEVARDTGPVPGEPENATTVELTGEPVSASGARQTDIEVEAVTRPKKRTGVAMKPRRRERPEKPVRITVDLDAGRHRFLRDFAYREDARGTEIVRALLDELGSDENLVERVRIRLDDAGE